MTEQPLRLQRRLPPENARAVGGPIAPPLLAGYLGLSLVGWLAAAVALVAAAPRLAAGEFWAATPLLAVHLLALGFLPLAVSGASFHLLPVMLRNPLRSERRLWIALPLLTLGAWLVAPSVAYHAPGLLWPGAALLTCGLLVVIVELGRLVMRAPRDRMLVASRTGVALSLFHATVALTLGAVVFDMSYPPLAGVSYDRWLLIHLHVAVLGWLALLILAVGRTLGPMLALAPAAQPRRLPLEELALTLGLWLLAAGIAADTTPVTYLGGGLVVVALGRFATLIVRVGRSRRTEPEGPLLHLIAGVFFLAQAAALGFAVLAGTGQRQRGLEAYVVLLLLGWGAGVTLGHLPKLLSLSIWVWWPPGPRPKQDALYPRRLAQCEAAAFAAGVETTALGIYLGSTLAVRAGAALVTLVAMLSAATCALIWRRKVHLARYV